MKRPSILLLALLPTAVHAQLPSAVCGIEALPDPGLDERDLYGFATALAGGVAVVSAPYDDDAGADAGAVLVYERSGADWVEVAKLTAGDAHPGDAFGWSVATDGLLIAVGSRGHLHEGTGEAGAAYVFEKQGGVWTEIDELFGGNRFVGGPNAFLGDDFGVSVGVHSDRVAVGAPGFGSWTTPDGPDGDGPEPGESALNLGRVYLFERDAAGWDINRRITLSHSCCGEVFGTQIALAQRRIAVLDPRSPVNPDQTHVFVRQSQGTWGLERTLTAPVRALAFRTGRTLVTADGYESVGGNFATGRVRVYERGGAGWALTQTVLAPTPEGGEVFGKAIACDGTTLLVGAEREIGAPSGQAGVVHAYQQDAIGTWVHRGTVAAPDAQDFDGFGEALDVEGTLALAGAPKRDNVGEPPVSNVGGAYAIDLAPVVAAVETALPGSPANPMALLPGATSGPVVGAVWDPAIDHTSFYPGATLDWLVVSTQAPINVPVAGGTLVCPLAGAKVRSAAPGAGFTLPVPPVCGLIGRTGCAQGASSGPSGLVLTNGLSLVVGSF